MNNNVPAVVLECWMWWLMGDSFIHSFIIHPLHSVRSKCPCKSPATAYLCPPRLMTSPNERPKTAGPHFIELHSQLAMHTCNASITQHITPQIDRCVCPSLKKFTCDHKNWCEDLFARQVSNGVKPVFLYGRRTGGYKNGIRWSGSWILPLHWGEHAWNLHCRNIEQRAGFVYRVVGSSCWLSGGFVHTL